MNETLTHETRTPFTQTNFSTFYDLFAAPKHVGFPRESADLFSFARGKSLFAIAYLTSLSYCENIEKFVNLLVFSPSNSKDRKLSSSVKILKKFKVKKKNLENFQFCEESFYKKLFEILIKSSYKIVSNSNVQNFSKKE